MAKAICIIVEVPKVIINDKTTIRSIVTTGANNAKKLNL
jgi:hypothetical protein